MDEFKRIVGDPVSRRGFLGRMTAAGLGVAAAGLLSGEFGGALATAAPGVRQDRTGSLYFPGIPGRTINEVILNFALTLEILEADLYRQALNRATGRALTDPLAADATSYALAVPATGLSTFNTEAAFRYLVDFAYVEAAHRDFLTAAISAGGGSPVGRAARGYKFPNGLAGDLKGILTNILPLEETGVRAYLGALPYFTSLPLAQTAGTIYSTEARHSAAINDTLGMEPGPSKMPGDKQVTPRQPSDNTLEYYLDPKTVISKVPAFLA